MSEQIHSSTELALVGAAEGEAKGDFVAGGHQVVDDR
jgi:hypothetical protein